MKLCKDCKHCVPDDSWARDEAKALRYARCARTEETHRVTGLVEIRDAEYCSVERIIPWPLSWAFRDCGKSGRYWEPKE